MERSEIIDRLRQLMIETDEGNRSVLERCTEASNLTTELGFSSVSLLYMVIAIEEEFGVRFEHVGAADFKTLGDVVDYLAARIQ